MTSYHDDEPVCVMKYYKYILVVIKVMPVLKYMELMLKYKILQVRILKDKTWETQVACIENGFGFLKIQLLAPHMHG